MEPAIAAGVSLKTHMVRRDRRFPLRLVTLIVAAAFLGGRAGAQPTGPVVLRQLYGDVGIEVRTGDALTMHIGAADGQKTIALLLLARDVARWADSASRVLAARAPAKNKSGRWWASVEEPGTRSGSMMLSRAIEKGDTVISIFLADSSLVGVRTTVDAYEARVFVAAMKRVAGGILAPTRPKPTGKRR
jgi:hypothetical protein